MSWTYLYDQFTFEKKSSMDEDYKYVEELFRQAVSMVGAGNHQHIFDYMAPKLRQRGLDPKKWISWVFNNRMI